MDVKAGHHEEDTEPRYVWVYIHCSEFMWAKCIIIVIFSTLAFACQHSIDSLYDSLVFDFLSDSGCSCQFTVAGIYANYVIICIYLNVRIFFFHTLVGLFQPFWGQYCPYFTQQGVVSYSQNMLSHKSMPMTRISMPGVVEEI